MLLGAVGQAKGVALTINQVVPLRKDDVVELGLAQDGSRAYVCVQGKPVLSSPDSHHCTLLSPLDSPDCAVPSPPDSHHCTLLSPPDSLDKTMLPPLNSHHPTLLSPV